MPRLQKHKTKRSKDNASGNARQYWGYHVTIPKGIAESMNLADGQKMFARIPRDSKKKKKIIYSKTIPNPQELLLQMSKDDGNDGRCCWMELTVSQFFTKRYKMQNYHSFKVAVPAVFVRLLHLQKNQDVDLHEMNKNTIVLTF